MCASFLCRRWEVKGRKFRKLVCMFVRSLRTSGSCTTRAVTSANSLLFAFELGGTAVIV